MHYFVYKLVDVRDDLPRYVGCTQDWERRLWDYIVNFGIP